MLQHLIKNLKSRNNFVICGHINPDADCIGSQVALSLILESIGKKTILLADNNIDKNLDFLLGNFTDKVDIEDFTFISVDVAVDRRLAVQGIKEKSQFSITIDHHQKEKSNSDIELIDDDAAATSILIWDIAKELNVTNKDIATACLCGLIGDTGSFRYQNADTKTFIYAKEMVEAGASAFEISSNLFQRRSLESFEVEKQVLNNLIVDKNNRFALSFIDSDTFQKYNATKSDAEGMIDLIRSLECVDVVCLLRQIKKDEKVHGSIRSKSDKDVSIFAKKHIGGGHKAAAGFTMDETNLENAVDIIRSQLKKFMTE